MADKAITELVAAEQITATDFFVLQQNDTAKKLPGQVLLNWLTAAADGHGGIKSIEKLKTNILADTYRITLADTTTFDFVVNNGRGISSISKASTSGLVDTYRISYNDGSTGSFTVTNGAKGDKGDNAYIWVKYASQEPTASSHSFGDLPDAWIGVYFGTSSIAPSDWQQYKWYQWKGAKGDKGDPATLVSSNVEYQASSSGTVVPSGSWSSSVIVVPQGMYLWTKITNTFNTGSPVISYSVSRMGLDGSGSVSSVANISPDENGNVPLTAEHIGAVPSAGGDMTGELRMNGQPISGLNMPTENDQAANKGYVDAAKEEANTYTNSQARKAAPRNLLDNSDFRSPVNQRGQSSYNNGYTIDRWQSTNANINVIVGDGKITLSKSKTGGTFCQYLPFDVTGKRLTLAINTSIGLLLHSFVSDGDDLSKIEGLSAYFGVKVSNGITQVLFYFSNSDTIEFDLYWAALYEGEYTIDTLPEYQPKGVDGAELLACQTQLQRFRTESERKTYCEDFRPTMRITPNGTVSKFEKEIDGIMYYFASAEL